MRCLTLKNPTGRRLSASPFAALLGAPAQLKWRYPEPPARLSVDPCGQGRFTVAAVAAVATNYARPAA